MEKRDYCVIIPAFQAFDTLPVLIDSIMDLIDGENIFIIDDGSDDGTAGLAQCYPKIKFLSHDVNKGKGAALITGIQAAIRHEYRYAVCLDADLQHDPKYIPHFFEAQRRNHVDLVLGKRVFDFNTMPFHRILSNTMTSFLISIRTGKRVHDSQCGYRLMNLKMIADQEFSEDGFQFESEILIKLLSTGCRYTEVKIPTIYNNARSSINNFRDTLKFVYLFFRSYLWT